MASFASGRGGGDGGRALGGDDDDKRGWTGEGTDGGGGGGEGEGYASKFRSALSLWRDHAGDVWYAQGGEFYGLPLPPPGRGDDYDNSGDVEDPPDRRLLDLGEKMAGLAPLSYRVSCMRSHGKRYGWRREDLIPPLSDIFVPIESSPCHSVSHSGSGSGTSDRGKEEEEKKGEGEEGREWPLLRWSVDLKRYDLEVVVIIHDNSVTVAIPLRPYQHLGARGYSSGKVPPDVTPPYILRPGGGLGSGPISGPGPGGDRRPLPHLVRLRPSTAAHLLRLSDIGTGDVVLDPCGGVGTIPVETSQLGGARAFGLGGDLAPGTSPDFLRLSSRYRSDAMNRLLRGSYGEGHSDGGGGVANLAA